ncbi:TnsD family transposase [Pantanalinema sp. GBBB05]|uniref:TnsD family transposase n=1 Tax=Pantanalinema sp. GBBB05 TaxID=2604139 RepID=UPI001D22D6C9|nr:transposase [Pantanalinema sp. GBBB05]
MYPSVFSRSGRPSLVSFNLRSRQMLEAMRAEDGSGIHDRVGIRASLITVPRYFRFCPQCLHYDQQTYGELYWHRIHQVPGVLVCPHHAELLQERTVPMQSMNRHEYIAADRDTCPLIQPAQPFQPKVLNLLHLLAQDADVLLDNELPPRDLNWFRQQYMAHLIDHRLATATGRVYQQEFLGQFLYFYGQDFLNLLESSIQFQNDQNWLSSIVRKHRKAFHPLRHLLMLRFLGISIADFFQGDRDYQPFGAGPWLCLNAAADHYLKPIVTHLEISLCCDTKKPVGTFSCSCGFIYCRTGPDLSEEDARRMGKIKAVGAVWQQKLRHLVEVEQLGLRATARQLQVDPRTINRYIERLGLTPKWRSLDAPEVVGAIVLPPTAVTPVDDYRTQHRQAWSTLQAQNPQASKTALRQLAPATYTWLYRHDREWLHQHSPLAQKPVYANNRVDWQARDEQILAQVQEAMQELLAAEKPIRITVSRVAKAIVQLALIEQHLDQMPQTKAYLESVIEGIEDYQIRRVQWAAETLDRRGERVESWKVVRLAGLRPDYSEKVEQEIGRLMTNQTNLIIRVSVSSDY